MGGGWKICVHASRKETSVMLPYGVPQSVTRNRLNWPEVFHCLNTLPCIVQFPYFVIKARRAESCLVNGLPSIPGRPKTCDSFAAFGLTDVLLASCVMLAVGSVSRSIKAEA